MLFLGHSVCEVVYDAETEIIPRR